MDGLTQSRIYDLPYNSNVYSVTIMHSIDGKEKIVMTCTKKDLITLETKTVNDIVEMSIVKLNFSNIPSKLHSKILLFYLILRFI